MGLQAKDWIDLHVFEVLNKGLLNNFYYNSNRVFSQHRQLNKLDCTFCKKFRKEFSTIFEF